MSGNIDHVIVSCQHLDGYNDDGDDDGDDGDDDGHDDDDDTGENVFWYSVP